MYCEKGCSAPVCLRSADQFVGFGYLFTAPASSATIGRLALSLQLSFLGGAGTVTSSKYLLENADHRLLIDCGLFQGFKALRLRNWERFPVDPRGIDAVLLTHAHLDHTGYLPLLIKQGFARSVFCSGSTADFCEILLPDSGYLQEKDAEFANRHGFSKHKPALPLYTLKDALQSLNQLKAVEFEQRLDLPGGARAFLRRAGHILGAASIDATMVDPVKVEHADYLVVESTYGNHRHDVRGPEDALAEIIGRTVERGGTVIVPAFAVGRAQSLLFHLHSLKASRRIPDVPSFLDSPMAVDASKIFCRHRADDRLTEQEC